MAEQQTVILGSVAGVGLLLGALILLSLGLSDMNPFGNNDNEPLAKTDCGDVRGTYDSKLEGFSFKGVPFAAPPTGNLRWKPPRAKSSKEGTCWSGTYDATKFANACAQIDFGSYEYVGSEDCLYLDIYTPSLKEKKPVFVYIHGGSLIGGNSHTANYAPTLQLAMDMDVVFVSIQYRLGALGFLVNSDLSNNRGNYGLLDSIESLRWIKNNIEAFGGDPENVGVFGHSSGGTLVYGMMVSDDAAGLFHRAWATGASPVLRGTFEEAVQRNSFFTERTGCGNATMKAECLQGLSAEVVTWSAYPEWGQSGSFGLPNRNVFDIPFLVIDGDVLRAGFRESFERRLGSVNDVPFMIGTTAQEAEFGPDLPENTPASLAEWTKEIYDTAVRNGLSTFGSSIPAEVLGLYNENDVTLAFTSLVSDVRLNCPNDVLARAAAEAMTSPVYQYVVTQRPSSPAFGLMNYAFHTWELFSFFDALDVVLFGAANDMDQKLVDMMQKQMRNFLVDGKPADPMWKDVQTNTAIFNGNITFVSNYNERKCNFWNNNGFYEYGSVN